MKLLAWTALFAELLVVAINVSGQPNQAADYKQNPTDSSHAVARASKPQNHQDAAKDSNGSSNGEPAKWYAAVKWPEWLLVVVGLLAVIMAWRTLNAINRQV